MSLQHPSHSRWDQPQLWTQGGYSHVRWELAVNLTRGASHSDLWISTVIPATGEQLTMEQLEPVEWGRESTVIRAIAHSQLARTRLLLEPF
jgi:hypothetical protein